MITVEALYKISYGLYIVCSGNKNHGNGYISNTVFQVSADPIKFAACCSKDNFTAGMISQTGAFSVSVLAQNASPDIFGRFGYRSGRDFNKLAGVPVKYGETGVPIVLSESLAFFECRVDQTIDTGTHLLFIGELLQSGILNDGTEPLTYAYYRQVRKGVAPKNAPTYIDKSKLGSTPRQTAFKKYQCTACGYIYDEAVEGIKFADLPAGWVCPSCGSEKEDFMEITI